MTVDDLRDHVRSLHRTLDSLEPRLERVDRWGAELAERLEGGQRLLVAGNGGSAAQAQHLTSELVGRFARERRPLSAIALHAESSTVTAVVNDYGPDEVFARQVLAHGRPGDVVLLLSTSGRSPNLLRAVEVAATVGCTTWGLTGPTPNPLAQVVDEVVSVDAGTTATVQEVHQAVVHLLCIALDARILGRAGASAGTAAVPVAAAGGGA